MDSTRKYKPHAVAAYNAKCSTRLPSNKLKDYLSRLDKLIELTTDDLAFNEDLRLLRRAINNLEEGFKTK